MALFADHPGVHDSVSQRDAFPDRHHPSLPGYGGTGAESTVALADEALRCQIEKEDPVLWETIRQRRAYIQQELGIVLHEDVLPMCDTVAYYRPLMLNREKVLKIKR